jgi:hypothetical protein
MLARLRPHRAFLLLLLASVALNAWGLDWGVPSRKGWAPDELLPQDVLRGQQQSFGGGWYERYPPLHYRLLALVYTPWLGSIRDVALLPLELHGTLTRVGRGVSLLFWVGLLTAVHACGLMLLTSRAALIADALVTLTLPLVFYAKLANLEVPYLCWWVTSLVFFLRALEGRRGATLALLAFFAALSVTTKDQAFALYVLMPIPILAQRTQGGDGSLARRLGRALTTRDIWLALLVAAATFALVHDLAFNAEGFRAHVLTLAAAGSAFRQFPADVFGQLALLRATAVDIAFGLGLPAACAALAGLALALRHEGHGRRLLPLLVPGVSYQVFFLAAALYCYDRFVLPWTIVLAFFAALLFDWLLARRGPARVLGALWLSAALLFGLGRAVSLDVQMQHDGRYAVEDWLAARVRPDDVVGQLAPSLFLPRLKPTGLRAVGPDIPEVEQRQPRFVVLNVAYARRAEAGSAERSLIDRLQHGQTPYHLVLDQRFESPWLMFDPAVLEGQRWIDSNLAKVNPWIQVYERGASAP